VERIDRGRIPEAPRWGLVDAETHELTMVMDYGEVRLPALSGLLPRHRLTASSLGKGFELRFLLL
jgi:hypothetical protein